MISTSPIFINGFYGKQGDLLEPNDSKSPSQNYLEKVDAFDNIVRQCTDISYKHASIRSQTSQHFYASVLFTLLCTRSVSLAILIPHSPWSKKFVEHWDYVSVASLTRSIFETRLAFYYLCIDQCSAEEWDCRWNIFNLHDCQSRRRLFEEMDPNSEDIQGFDEQTIELRERLQKNSFFITLSEKQQTKFLKGKDAYILPLEIIAEKAGIDTHTFRWMYQLLSNQVHALPMSFYRMDDNNRSRGLHSNTEEGYTSLCISFTVSLLVRTRDEFLDLFSKM